METPQILSFMERTAEKFGWRLTPDQELIGYLIEGFQTNLSRYGYLQCPCREGQGERGLDKDILCPCDYAEADIAQYGQCFCGLYVNEMVYRQGGAPGSIPERRNPDLFSQEEE